MIPIFPREGMVEQLQATKGLPLSSRLVNPDVNTHSHTLLCTFAFDVFAKKSRGLGGLGGGVGVGVSHQRYAHHPTKGNLFTDKT